MGMKVFIKSAQFVWLNYIFKTLHNTMKATIFFNSVKSILR